MDCRQTREFMSALVDNEEIDSQTKQKLEEHIWRCATCRIELELEKKTKETIQSKVKIIPVPNELITSVLNQIRSIQDGYPSSLQKFQSKNPAPKPWLEVAFALGVVIVTLSVAVLFTSIYENKLKQKDLVIREVSPLVKQFDSIAKGFTKPEILSDNPEHVWNEAVSRAGFTPKLIRIPQFKMVGASVKDIHSNSNNIKCVNLIYRKGDTLILFHQAPLKTTNLHEDVKKRILKGEWIYDEIDNNSFAIWGTEDLACCAISNLRKEDLEKILKQRW
ncbi:MAG: zf-HC2 domain-containing protein [Candidatus Kryptonium sp.]|nr:zf-HC2 domain-containing protein [Candidatus Kryptonium sp.]MDW8109272.1 zf-HC2 domain-containing protein [Candidatus Kryptonium sp.]